MNQYRITFSVTVLVLLIFGCERRLCGCITPSSPLAGDWNLTKITYGLTQKTVTAVEAGYTESISFGSYSDTKGNYQRVRNGIPLETTEYSLSFPNGGSSEGVIYFPKDTTQQSFWLNKTALYLSERIPRGATIADGSTYEYQR